MLLDWVPANDPIILELVRQRPTPALVLVAGASCSGKTTFAGWLERMLPNAEAICMDRYFLDGDDPRLPPYGGKYPAFDQPEAYHYDEIEYDLGELMLGHDVRAPIYDVATNSRTEGTTRIRGSRSFIILEGLYAFRIGRAALRIFMAADTDICFERRVRRDEKRLPHIRLENIKSVAERVGLAGKDLVAPQRLQADLMLISNIERGDG